MFESIKRAMKKSLIPEDDLGAKKENKTIMASLRENMVYLYGQFGTSSDFMVREITIADIPAAVVTCEGMVDKDLLARSVVEPILLAEHMPRRAGDQLDYIRAQVVTNVDAKDVYQFSQAIELLLSGFALLFIDGVACCEAYGVQGYPTRSIEDSETQAQERGPREGFVEAIKMNMTLVRRRLKTPQARFEMMTLGSSSNTQVCICYMSDRVDTAILDQVKRRLADIKLDIVMESGYVQPFLDTSVKSMFTAVGVIERPDSFCAKLSEGKVGVLVDGTPFALVVPYLFIENFHSPDDYAMRPYYAVFLRFIKLISFFISIFLPGLYVAIATFHQELLPESVLYDIVSTHARTPLPIMLEAVLIHLIYEIMREAGLRIPKQMGHAVSIIGAIVIGDAAVSAGVIAPPMLIIVAISAITSYVTPALFEPISILRFLFIFAGGFLGFYGLVMLGVIVLVNLCAINPYGIPYMSPISPYYKSALRDMVYRAGWKNLSKHKMVIQDFGTQHGKAVR
ncbi:MAG TPA: spore germination protein [Candidatus Onthovicinus excrementipullorum]|nr:spore germination protein [Candidatus Onthovicinus excrementipullorum]